MNGKLFAETAEKIPLAELVDTIDARCVFNGAVLLSS